MIMCVLFTQEVVFALENGNISVDFKEQKLKSKLKRQYKGYEVIIVNKDEKPINIEKFEVVNGVNGEVAYNTVYESPGGTVGQLWIVCGPLGLISFGIAWVIGLIETPIAYFVVKKLNKNAKEESLLYLNKIETDTLEANEKTSVYTLIPKKLLPKYDIKK